MTRNPKNEEVYLFTFSHVIPIFRVATALVGSACLGYPKTEIGLAVECSLHIYPAISRCFFC